MTRQILNTGTSANDGTGDTLREASEKINQNFQELYEAVGFSGGEITLDYLDAYINGAVDSALDGVDLSGVIANTQALNSLDARVTQHDTILISHGSDLGGLAQEIQAINDLIDGTTIGGQGPQGPAGSHKVLKVVQLIGPQGGSRYTRYPRWYRKHRSNRTTGRTGCARHSGWYRKYRSVGTSRSTRGSGYPRWYRKYWTIGSSRSTRRTGNTGWNW